MGMMALHVAFGANFTQINKQKKIRSLPLVQILKTFSL